MVYNCSCLTCPFLVSSHALNSGHSFESMRLNSARRWRVASLYHKGFDWLHDICFESSRHCNTIALMFDNRGVTPLVRANAWCLLCLFLVQCTAGWVNTDSFGTAFIGHLFCTHFTLSRISQANNPLLVEHSPS